MKLFEQQPGTKAHLPKAIPFDRKNFTILTPEAKRTAYIDGGNAEIKGGTNYSIQLIRTYATIWKEKREFAARKEKTIVVQIINNNKMEFTSSNGEQFEYEEKGLMTGNRAPTPAAIAEHIRRLEEIKLAIETAEQAEITVLDGNLETSTETEEKLMQELKKRTELAGLSKTTNLVTDSGMGLPEALEKTAPKGIWAYAPIAEESETTMIKLHELGKIFRMDGNKEIANTLAMHAKDATFPGYPYPLIEADNLARITNNETMKYRLLLDNTHANDAHEILNMITRR